MPLSTLKRSWWVLSLLLALPGLGHAQSSDIRGRVMDRASGSAVEGASVVLEGVDTTFLAVTDGRGLFTFPAVNGGRYQVRVEHLAYGEHLQSVDLEPGVVLALRILITQQAIELEPLVVESMSQRQLQARARGTMIQEVTQAEIERAARTSFHFGDILRQTVPGLQVRDTPSLPGARLCVEFRGRRSVRWARSCQTPVLFLDGVRMWDPPSLYSTIQPNSIQRIEVIPPAEAGLLYGTESANGVLLVETKLWLEEGERDSMPAHLRGGAYDWSLEVEKHPWKRVFASSFVGSALGLAAGIAIADRCMRFEEMATDLFASDCDRWPSAGAWAAALTLPLAGAALGAHFAGATPISRGRFLPTMVSGAVALLPGYGLLSASGQDRSSPTFTGGQVMLLVGIPFAVTVADHLFRRFRGS